MTYPASTMHRAVELAESEWKPVDIQRILDSEGRGRPALSTILRWVDPEFAARRMQSQIAAGRLKRSRTSRFRLPGESEEYRLAFITALRVRGVSCHSIGEVHGIVFGQRLTSYQVRYLFRESDPKPRARRRSGAAA